MIDMVMDQCQMTDDLRNLDIQYHITDVIILYFVEQERLKLRFSDAGSCLEAINVAISLKIFCGSADSCINKRKVTNLLC